MKEIPVFAGGQTEFVRWHKLFLAVADRYGLREVLEGDSIIEVGKVTVSELLKLGYSARVIGLHVSAWQMLTKAIQNENDKSLVSKCTAPTAAWWALVDAYSFA